MTLSDKSMTRITIHPWGTFDVDPTTGMPVLPEGQFWRVKRIFFGQFWEVQLRQRGMFWSYKVESRTFGNEAPITRDNVLNGAGHCLKEVAERRAAHESAKGEPVGKDLLGDYPPKRLT